TTARRRLAPVPRPRRPGPLGGKRPARKLERHAECALEDTHSGCGVVEPLDCWKYPLADNSYQRWSFAAATLARCEDRQDRQQYGGLPSQRQGPRPSSEEFVRIAHGDRAG